MQSYAEKKHESLSTAAANRFSNKSNRSYSAGYLIDSRPEAIAQRKLQEVANDSHKAQKTVQLQVLLNNYYSTSQSIQKKASPEHSQRENKTGIPNKQKVGIEHLSAMFMDGVKVNHNSSQPAQLNALAYKQDMDTHVGSGQEQHILHEGGDVVQQKQGRVKPTVQAKGVSINDDTALENEVDVMGAKALQMRRSEKARLDFKSIQPAAIGQSVGPRDLDTGVVQRQLKVYFRSTENGFKIDAAGRPKGWAPRVRRELTTDDGQARGHIIEWNTRLRAFLARARQMTIGQLKVFIDSKALSDADLQRDIHNYLKRLYNDLTNLALNDAQADSRAGGLANKLAQQVDQTTPGSMERQNLLKELFQYSYNPGLDNIDDLLPQYINDFSAAWGVDAGLVYGWAEKYFPQQQTTTTTAHMGMAMSPPPRRNSKGMGMATTHMGMAMSPPPRRNSKGMGMATTPMGMEMSPVQSPSFTRRQQPQQAQQPNVHLGMPAFHQGEPSLRLERQQLGLMWQAENSEGLIALQGHLARVNSKGAWEMIEEINVLLSDPLASKFVPNQPE